MFEGDLVVVVERDQLRLNSNMDVDAEVSVLHQADAAPLGEFCGEAGSSSWMDGGMMRTPQKRNEV